MAASLTDDAARWFTRMAYAEPDDPERGRFESWLAASPQHAAEYARFAELWADFDSTPRLERLAAAAQSNRAAQGAQQAQDEQRRLETRRQSRRRALRSGALGLAGLGLGWPLWNVWQQHRAAPLWQAERRSGGGQSLVQALPDGGRITLAPRGEVAIAYHRDRRVVQLLDGEALFEVTPDAARPFSVVSGEARVTVLGTRFVVARLAGGAVRVSVIEGRVTFQREAQAGSPEAGLAQPLSSLTLSAGDVAELHPGEPPRAAERRAADAIAWQRGALVFEHDTLAEVAARLTRFGSRPVDAGAVSAHPARITAVVQLRDSDAFVRSLPAIAGVKLRDSGAGWVLEPR